MTVRVLITLACLALAPLAQLQAQTLTQTPAAKPALPQLSVELSSLSYPNNAQRAGVQGRVLVAFTITKKGRADNIEIVSAEPAAEFDLVATKAVKQVRFTVPEDWETSGADQHRFQLSVLFKLGPCPAETCTAPKAHETADDFLVIGSTFSK